MAVRRKRDNNNKTRPRECLARVPYLSEGKGSKQHRSMKIISWSRANRILEGHAERKTGIIIRYRKITTI